VFLNSMQSNDNHSRIGSASKASEFFNGKIAVYATWRESVDRTAVYSATLRQSLRRWGATHAQR
jgi:hypothetical protein